jgi:hypothetical protein
MQSVLRTGSSRRLSCSLLSVRGKFGAMKLAHELPIAVNQDCDQYPHDRCCCSNSNRRKWLRY